MFLPSFNDDFLPDGYVRIKSGEHAGLICRKEYLDLAEDEKRKICNGIGAASGLSKNFPNTVYGLDIGESGNIHDFDYHVGGTREDKKIADQVLLRNARYTIRKGSWLLRYARYSRVNKYYIAVALGGHLHFNFR